MPRTASPPRGREQIHDGSKAPEGASAKGKLRIIGRELPDIDSDEQFRANWKISKAREEALLVEFHDQLEAAGLLRPEHDKYYIRRFLRARQHDLARAKQMFADHVAWRKEFEVEAIVHDFKFHERDAFMSLYPQGYHKTDKLGRPVYIQHLGAINIKKLNEITSEDRMLKFHIQEYERCIHYIMPACSRICGRHIEQTFAVIDVTGVGLSHLTGQVKNLLSKITSIDQSNYPEMMGKTVIINAPSMFKLVWGIVKRFLDARTLSKIELHGSNYKPTLLGYIADENLPEYLGGSSKATLLDDAGPWQDKDLIAEIDADYRAASEGLAVEADATSPAEPRSPGEAAGGGDEHQRAQSPKRKLSLRNFRRVPSSASGPANGEAEAFHDSLELQSRSLSIASEDEGGYYSPRSTSSFSSAGHRDSEETPLHPHLEAFDPAKALQSPGHRREMTMAARIRRLEEALGGGAFPGLADKLARLDLRLQHGSFTRSSGHNISGRVEVLEDAVEALLTMQEEKLLPAKPEPSQPEKPSRGCLCCSIM